MIETRFMDASASRPFAIHVAWRPTYGRGTEIAGRLREHFTHRRYQDVVGGTGLPVLFHAVPTPGGGSLFRINWRGAAAAATVLLLDGGFPDDAAATADLERLAWEARESGPGFRLLPIVMEDGALPAGLALQALRPDRWEGSETARTDRLFRELDHVFCQMLLRCLRQIEAGQSGAGAVPAPERVRVFLSHSKHDDDGETIAVGLRDWIDRNTSLSTFFDLRDIPPGADFAETLRDEIEMSAFVAVHSDSYSARGACRSEVLEAKRRDRPFLVLDCLRRGEDRAFPYLGNVRTLRVDPDRTGPADFARITGSLLDEVFRHLLWQCRVAALPSGGPAARFATRPPEALSLSTLPGADEGFRIVHPDPKLPSEEAEVMRAISPGLRLLTLAEWREEAGSP